LFRPIFRYKTVIDCHNAGLKPSEGRSFLLNAIAKFSLTRAHLVIMHNEIVAMGLPINLKKFIILPDPIPEISAISSKEINSELRHEKKIVFICRWAEDEPYNEVIKTASNMLTKFPDITIYITGKPPKVILEQELPGNIKLTGFLDHASYNELLSGAYALVALTTRSDSLNCAGYEAIAYKKPIVLSDSETLKKFFNKGCLFTDNSSNDLESKLIDLMDNYDELVADITTFKDDYNLNYLAMLNELQLLTP
jgi:glycosyltransferase involved in cell wall biosynthesis